MGENLAYQFGDIETWISSVFRNKVLKSRTYENFTRTAFDFALSTHLAITTRDVARVRTQTRAVDCECHLVRSAFHSKVVP